MLYKKLFLSLFATIYWSFTYSQYSKDLSNIALPFLLINADIHSAGMGNTFLATDADAGDVYNNFAKINRLETHRNFTFNYTPYFQVQRYNDIYLTNIGYSQKINSNSSFFAAFRYFSYGELTLTDIQGNIIQTSKPNDLSIDVGYTRSISNSIDIGASFRFVNSHLFRGNALGNSTYYSDGRTAAVNLSIFYQQDRLNDEGLKVGLLLSNLGGKIGYTNEANNKSFIPASLNIGAGYNFRFDRSNSLDFGFDIFKLLVPPNPLDQDETTVQEFENQSLLTSYGKSFFYNSGSSNWVNNLTYNLGSVYNFEDFLLLRLGYSIQQQGSYFSTGLTFKYNSFALHLSYALPYESGKDVNPNINPVSNTLRAGIGYSF